MEQQAEWVFQGVELNVRNDGRGCQEFRSSVFETGVLIGCPGEKGRKGGRMSKKKEKKRKTKEEKTLS
jgi:hypothetical protein